MKTPDHGTREVGFYNVHYKGHLIRVEQMGIWSFSGRVYLDRVTQFWDYEEHESEEQAIEVAQEWIDRNIAAQ